MNKLGYVFKNKEILGVALTHSSFSQHNYERLEFLGDSILDFLVADYFFKQTEQKEGVLTKLRSNFVYEIYLCKVFDELNLENDVKLGKSYKGEISVAIKADIVEALIAGVYLDCNDLEVVRNIVLKLLKLDEYKHHIGHDFKSELQEYVQSKNQKVNYRLVKKSGESHNPIWTMAVFMNNEKITEGTSSSKNKAEQICAQQALDFLKGEKNDRN